MINVDPRETPKDQEWIHVPEFEAALYDGGTPPVPVRRLTNGPKYHWFGYYDKYETDPSDRYVLAMEVDFDARSVRPGDQVGVGMVDRERDDAWVPLGTTTAWGWQQGCMLQWLPRSEFEVIYNICLRGKAASRIVDVRTRDERILAHPIYHIHPSGRSALCLDFARTQRLRPGYGYWIEGADDTLAAAPEESGVSYLDLESGETKLLVSIATVAGISYPDSDREDDVHYFNHAQWSPEGRRFLFLHRWRSSSGRFTGFRTRILTASADGSDLRVVCPEGHISHFVWQDDRHINAWIDGAFYLVSDDANPRRELLWQATNGHQSYLKSPRVLIADTYADKERFQNLYIFDRGAGRPVRIGRFYLPAHFRGEWRCDLHPRISRDGRRLFIDSAHEGLGRQVYEVTLPG